MRLNHVDLAVPDVIASRDFFTDYLGFEHLRTLGQGGLAVLKDSSGTILVFSRLRRGEAQVYPDGFHIGFYLAHRREVIALYNRLLGAASGAGTPSQPCEQRGTFSFYFTAPGGVLVEIAAPASD